MGNGRCVCVWWLYGSVVLKALIQALSSSGFLDLQRILPAAL